jgi:chromosome segregation ATPase
LADEIAQRRLDIRQLKEKVARADGREAQYVEDYQLAHRANEELRDGIERSIQKMQEYRHEMNDAIDRLNKVKVDLMDKLDEAESDLRTEKLTLGRTS